MTKVVVVESPAKAKTINKYLGNDYKVIASYGHVRDLPSKDGSVKPDEGFEMEWSIEGRSEKNIKDIAASLKDADELYLATDPDREGEAISWHVKEVMENRGKLKDIDVKRVVFNSITKNAIAEAMAHPKDIDDKLVEAYLARRALDYLVGFNLSPILWRKLPGSRSAGRVQSVALRLICEREREIEIFNPREYWSIETDLQTPEKKDFTAKLIKLKGMRLNKFSLSNESLAKAAKEAVEKAFFSVGSVERSKAKRNPYPPFTTSTLQQDASYKLGFGAKRTMQIAQRLYEAGYITYMRTDSVQIDNGAINEIRSLIKSDFGDKYLPHSPKRYITKAKNAQEGHEAIRPTEITKKPREMSAKLDKDEVKLYDLIWKRAVACQMQSAELDRVSVDSVSEDKKIALRSTGSIISFDGFLKLYNDKDNVDNSKPKKSGDEEGNILPPMKEGDALNCKKVKAEQHFTKPPPRYSEASLVKKMEELGIGRPSTYASIITVLQDRDYVKLENKKFIPEDRGRIVTAFLENFFSKYVQYNFTADMEEQLDEISNGKLYWKDVLENFWQDFIKHVQETKGLTITEVLDTLNETLGHHFFPEKEDGSDPRQCPSCGGQLSLKVGKFGGFIGCSNYPECKYTKQLSAAANGEEGDEAAAAANGGVCILGVDEATGFDITLRKGR